MSDFEHLKSVAYREGPLAVADYDEAIEALKNARDQIASGDYRHGCAVCSDSGHDAKQCHHNPLILARQWAAATNVWQCWHCGFIATNEVEARGHFGPNEHHPAECQLESV